MFRSADGAQLERISLEKLRQEVQVGIEALRTGKFTEYDSAEDLIADIVKEGQKRLAKR